MAATVALAKIAEGGVTSHLDLEAAETALQALLLHERVHVLTHAPKVDFGNGHFGYKRQDEGRRSELAFQLMHVAGARDFLIAPELVRIQDGRVISSTSAKSPLLGRMADQLAQGRPYWSEDVEDAINATIDMHGIPAYLTDPALIRKRRGEGFAKDFYTRMRAPWDKVVGDVPPVVCSFTLPPFLAIVLERANNRADLGSVIADLREELINVRSELREFNYLVTASTTQTEVEARIRRITESFDAVVPETRKTVEQRRWRNLMSLQKMIKPIRTIATVVTTKHGFTFEQALEAAGGFLSWVERSDAIVERTVTAKTFVGLLRDTEALQALVKHHFTPSELLAIEKSMRKDRS